MTYAASVKRPSAKKNAVTAHFACFNSSGSFKRISFNKSKIIYSLKEEFPLGSVLKKYNFKEEEIKEYIKNKNIEKESIFTIKEVIQNMGGKYEY